MSSDKQKGISDSDNEMAGRLLMMGVFAIVMFFFLLISPILIGGFLIGLTWYGAYIEDGEPNGEKIVWPVIITLTVMTYLFGVFPPFSHYYEGALFTDFWGWTRNQAVYVMDLIDAFLPKKVMIRSISREQMQMYGWSYIPSAIGFFAYLHFKGAGRGVFLYRGLHILFAPFRMAAIKIWWTVGIGALLIIASSVMGLSSSVSLALVIVLIGISVYNAFMPEVQSERVETKSVTGSAVTLGHEKGKPNRKVTLSDQELNHHVHIVGASGFGKSVLLSHLIKERISSGSGMLFVDLKADFETIRQVISTAKSANRLDDLVIFSMGNPEISDPYNVIGSGTANQLKDRIMGALNWSEEFYKNEASSFLLKLLRGLTALRDEKGMQFDLTTILKCIDEPRQIAGIGDSLATVKPDIRAELDALMSHLLKPDNVRCLQGLRSQLESLLLSDFGHLLKSNPRGIDLFQAIRDHKIVFVLLDSRTYGESSRALGKLILQDLKAASARVDNEIPRNNRMPFGVIVDEFADMASEDFIGFLDRARSSKIGVVVAHQEIADLSRISPEFARRLMNSTSTLFAFLQKLPDSSELISGIAGTRKTKEVTEQAKSNWLFGDEKTGMKSIKEVDEFMIHPNIVRSLSVGECVLVQKYPKAKSLVMKVKPESKNYLTESEVKATLVEMRSDRGVDVENPITKTATVSPPPGYKRPSRLKTEDSSYWKDDEASS